MSFVNLMGYDVWTEQDIVNRTESMIASEFPLAEQNIINRKVTGAMLGQYTLSEEEQIQVNKYKNVCEQAQLAGIEARRDMALLNRVFIVEKAVLRLRQPVVEPVYEIDSETGEPTDVITNQEDIDRDNQERTEAQQVVDSATQEEMNLALLRNPEPEPIPEEPIVNG